MPVPYRKRAGRGHTRSWYEKVSSSELVCVGIALFLVVTFMSISTSNFLTVQNLTNVAENTSFTAIAALGMMLVMITGGIDLSVGSVMAMSAVVMFTVMGTISGASPDGSWSSYLVHLNEFPVLVLCISIFAAFGSAVLAGLISGFCVVFLGLPPFVTTLGMLSIVRGLVYVMTGGRGATASGPSSDYLYVLTSGSIFGIPLIFVYLLVAAIALHVALRHTAWGRHIFAVGGNEAAANASGVPVTQVKMKVYVFCSLAAGLQGALLAGWLGSAPANMALGYELYVVASTVLGGVSLTGGVGSALGTLLGCSLLEVIRNGLVLAQINAYWQQVFAGAIIIMVISVDKLRARFF